MFPLVDLLEKQLEIERREWSLTGNKRWTRKPTLWQEGSDWLARNIEALQIGEEGVAGPDELTPPDFAIQDELRSMALEIPAILQLLKETRIKQNLTWKS